MPNALGKVAPGTPTNNRFSIQKDSSKQPSLDEEQAKADAKKAYEKANDAKAGEKAEKKKATKKATFNDDYKEEQPEGITKPKGTSESKAAPQHRDAQGPKAATKPRAIPEASSRVSKLSLQDESPGGTSKANPELMLQSALWMLQMAFLLLQSGPQAQASQATGGLLGRVRNLPGPRPPVDQAIRPRDEGAKGVSKGGSKDNRYLYIVLTLVALITGV